MYNTGRRDQLTSLSYNEGTSESFSYDGLGNPTTYRGKILEWCDVNKLASYNGNEFAYNAGGKTMKKFVPLKYILGMIALFLIIPMSIILLIAFVIGYNDFTVAISIFLGALVISGPFTYFHNQECASIVIHNNTITNYISDGTDNFGWCEELSKVKKVQIVDKIEVQKYFKQFNKKQAILIDFGNCNIKYIYIGLFSKSQIRKLIELISPN